MQQKAVIWSCNIRSGLYVLRAGTQHTNQMRKSQQCLMTAVTQQQQTGAAVLVALVDQRS